MAPRLWRQLEQFPLHRLRNIAIYTRWVAMERVARRDRAFNERWFQDLLRALEREVPAIGLAMPRPVGP